MSGKFEKSSQKNKEQTNGSLKDILKLRQTKDTPPAQPTPPVKQNENKSSQR